MTKKEIEVRDELISRFDFEKVRALMIVNNWTWHGDKYPPTTNEMKATVQSLFAAICNTGRANNRSSTGGFAVTKFTWDSEAVEYEISFVWEKAGTTI